MAGRNTDLEQDEKPLDPAAERVRQRLVRFMAINLGILFFAVMVVIGAVVYRSWTKAEAPVAEPAPPVGETARGQIVLPKGAMIISQSLSGGRVSLHIAVDSEDEAILVYDIATGRLIGHYDIVKP
jgi:heme/copper-type cytochrome/quinol oxidase subunit 2